MRFILFLLLINTAIAQQTINDLTVKDFKVISTQKASTPCPAMTQTQRDAAPSGSAKCVFNTTTGKLNVHNGSLWKAAGGGVDAWATATVYAVDDLVIQSTKIYRCLIAHTSGTFATDLAASKWEEISAYPTDYVSTSGNQTIGGTKTFSSTIVGSINGNAATVTTNANLTGAVTSTGNATLLGSFSSSNLLTALSDETGSGSAVFSTSPTLVTPTLGAATGTSLGLGGSLAANTIFSALSTTAASIPAPKMTTAQKNAITPISGMAVFDTDLGMLQYYNGSRWVANTNIQLNNVYSAQMNSFGTVSNENTDWINGSCSYASSEWTCPFNTGLVTTGMNCTVNVTDDTSGASVRAVTSTSASVKFKPVQDGTAYFQKPVSITCQKGAGDYQSTDAYISSNSNYSSASSTPTFTGMSSFTPSTDMCTHSRYGEDMIVRCSMSVGAAAASLNSMTIPDSKSLDSAKLKNTATTSGPCKDVGTWRQNGGTAYGAILACPGTSTTILYFGKYTNSSGQLTPQLANDITTGTLIDINYRIPISGWTNSNLIVASLQGTPNIPGSTVKVDQLTFTFGTTNASTQCSASPCSYLDQLGSGGVTSVTRSGTGSYTLNVARTYSKLKCPNTALEGGGVPNGAVGSSCANCSSLSFTTQRTSTGTNTDANGTMTCYGEY